MKLITNLIHIVVLLNIDIVKLNFILEFLYLS